MTTSPLPEPLLCDIAEGIAASTALWQAVACHDETERRPVRLLATDDYEVWVIGWTSGQGVDFHDHGDAAGALVVTEGELVELRPSRDPGRVGEALERRVLTAGTTLPLPVGLVHDVVNVGGGPATSIHVYSPPLTRMTRYDAATLEPRSTDLVVPEAPALAAADAALLVHPATRS